MAKMGARLDNGHVCGYGGNLKDEFVVVKPRCRSIELSFKLSGRARDGEKWTH